MLYSIFAAAAAASSSSSSPSAAPLPPPPLPPLRGLLPHPPVGCCCCCCCDSCCCCNSCCCCGSCQFFVSLLASPPLRLSYLRSLSHQQNAAGPVMMSVHTRNLSKDCSDIEVLRHACATTGHAECYFELIDRAAHHTSASMGTAAAAAAAKRE